MQRRQDAGAAPGGNTSPQTPLRHLTELVRFLLLVQCWTEAGQESERAMAHEAEHHKDRWLNAKLRNFYPSPGAETVQALTQAVHEEHAPEQAPLFENPFVASESSGI